MLKQLFSSVLVHSASISTLTLLVAIYTYHYWIHFSFEEWSDTNAVYKFFSNLVPLETFQPITESLSSRIGNTILL